MNKNEKVQENRIRRRLDRLGYKLVKSRSRDPHAPGYGLYQVINLSHGGCDFGYEGFDGAPSATLAEVEVWLNDSDS